jgi:hypothetical protein
MSKPETNLERQIRTVRRLIGYCEVLAEHLSGTQESGYIADAIADGEHVLLQLGRGVARAVPVGPLVAHGQRLMAA